MRNTDFNCLPRGLATLVLTVTALVLTVAALAPRTAMAAPDLGTIRQRMSDAMESYLGLEVESARSALEALRNELRDEDLPVQLKAQLHMNLGIVLAGGFQDAQGGRAQFMAALRSDPDASPDPMLSTPLIRDLFEQARQELAGSGARETSAGPTNQTMRLPSHQPVSEHPSRTPLPLHVDPARGQDIGRAQLVYRSAATDAAQVLEMQRLGQGWSRMVPCEHLAPPALEYFMVLYDGDGARVAMVGNPAAPIQVRVSDSAMDLSAGRGPATANPCRASRPEPARRTTNAQPATPSSDEASADDTSSGAPEGEQAWSSMAAMETECPPGMPGCDGGGAEDYGEGEDRAPASSTVWLQVGLTGTAALVTPGMLPDKNPPANLNKAQATSQGWDCDSQAPESVSLSNCTVALTGSGMAVNFALKATGGVRITDRIEALGSVRFQPDHGAGSFAGLLVGAHGAWLALPPTSSGIYARVSAGLTYGQIQAQPERNTNQPGPYVLSGMNGASAGAHFGYKFNDNFAVFANPELNLMFPRVLLDVDLTAGLEIGY